MVDKMKPFMIGTGSSPNDHVLTIQDGVAVWKAGIVYAPLSSPAFTGTPTAPTAAPGTNTTQLSTTSFVAASLAGYLTAATATSTYFTIGDAALKANLAAPAFTGAATFAARPTFNGQTPWDAGNFTPGNYATLASPSLTGVPISPTAAPGTNTTQIATTAFVTAATATYLTSATATSTYAPLESPAMTGNPTAVTQTTGNNSTRLATTAFVAAAVSGYLTSATASSTYFTIGNAALKANLAAPAFTGAATFSARPTFNGATPWDSGNLTPSNYAVLASPTFTGTPLAPTATPGTNTTQLATTAFVTTGLNLKASLVSPAFTGTATFAARPAFNGATPWDSGNLTPANYAALASPTFTGVPLAPTATAGTNTAQLATTAFVAAAVGAGGGGGGAPIDSPAFTGVPAAPTAPPGTNTTQLATTAFVTTADNLKASLVSPALTGTPTSPTATVGNNTTQIATTAFVTTAVAAIPSGPTGPTGPQTKAFTGFCSGKPTASEIISGGVAPYAMTLNGANSSVKSSIAATSSTVLVIKKNGTQVGTITFSAAGTVGVVAITTADVAATDLLTVTAPATPDAALSDISIMLKE